MPFPTSRRQDTQSFSDTFPIRFGHAAAKAAGRQATGRAANAKIAICRAFARTPISQLGIRWPTRRPPDAKIACGAPFGGWQMPEKPCAEPPGGGGCQNYRLPCHQEQLLRLPVAGPSVRVAWDSLGAPGPYHRVWSVPCGMVARPRGRPHWAGQSQFGRPLEARVGRRLQFEKTAKPSM